MSFRGLWRLTWLEMKIFAREPLGLFGTIGVPVLTFAAAAKLLGPRIRTMPPDMPKFITTDLPVFASLLIAASAVLSLVTIVAIYREGGILKRLRATPLRPYTILTAHVLVKLAFTVITLALMGLLGRRYYPVDGDVPIVSFTIALLFATVCVISLGFIIASVVPTARFAQPIATLVLYPALALSGLLVPLDALPPVVRGIARVLPFTYAVSLLRGVWHGEGWIPHAGDAAVLAAMLAVFVAASSRFFRWE
jgi:ABC-2 type transport system permease protein